ncbi:hypothetical protein [Rhizobium leguminosarum]|uniref:Uncharacterized protein n=1 Tax=Rhizobium leguminosarum TaxID=384 RepID=A0A1B1CHX0_RHILE|nr:hypothetical protein [Rhizobium leguminosarum]ANP89344.1 hypothetical protein BA011_26650 [Rhizobium leguminosarum]
MTKRERAFFVKRVRDGKKGFAKADYGKREVAIEDIGKRKPKKPKHKKNGVHQTGAHPCDLAITSHDLAPGIHVADRIVQTAKDTRWHSPFHTIGERF